MGIRTAKWNSEETFNPGTTENFISTELVGSGSSATIQLSQKANSDDDIAYSDSANYTYSDATKITVDENDSNYGSLKILTSSDINYPFETPANYTYDSSEIDVNVIASNASLKNNQPANATCFACYNSDINLTWGNGVLTGTAVGGASVSGGYLDLAHDDIRYVQYDANGNADSQQVGCFRIKLTPYYSGVPTTNYSFIMVGANTVDGVNQLGIIHNTAGQIRIVIRDQNGNGTSATLGVWTQTSGQPYVFELNYDFTTGATRLFIDGTQFGTTNTTTQIRSSDINILRIGTWNSAEVISSFKIDYFAIFDAVQHTTNHVIPDVLPTTVYSPNVPIIQNSVAFTFASALLSFTETATKPANTGINYQVSSDNGSIWKWWNGSNWLAITTSSDFDATGVNTTVGTLISGDVTDIQELDGSLYKVGEVGGSPGFTILFDFDSCSVLPEEITIYAQYTGNLAHVVNVDIYNFETSSWVTLGQIPSGGAIVTEYNFTVTGTFTDYLDENYNVDVRINHTSSGVISHEMYIDYIFISGTPTNSWYYDNESNTYSDVNTNVGNLANSGSFKFLSFFKSDGTDTPLLDNVYIAESVTYSTQDNLYIDTTDTSQITPSGVISWLTLTATDSIPTNTDIRVMLSVDGRTTWLSWNGSAWTNPGSWTVRSNATPIATAITNFGSLPIGNATLDVRLFLYTSDSTTTPTMSNLNIISYGGYETSGSYRSASYKPLNNTNGVCLKTVTFDITEPSGTSARLLVRHLAEPVFEDGYIEYNSGDEIDICGDAIQWRANLTSNGLNTPVINYVYVTFHTLIGVWNATLSSIESLNTLITTLNTDLAIVKKIETGRWRIVNNQMIFYDDDDTTPLLTFDLKDENGDPTEENPVERTPV